MQDRLSTPGRCGSGTPTMKTLSTAMTTDKGDNALVGAPYKPQLNLLSQVLPAAARGGMVDKFQGQEAELVMVSMTTSREHDLPRSVGYLHSKNRINVAISRMKCLTMVIANSALMGAGCRRTPDQMALVNMLCRVAQVRRLE